MAMLGPAEAPEPPGDLPKTLFQAVTFSTLDSSSYSGTFRTDVERGYGVAVGACTMPCSSYNDGISISSSATSRRSATIMFVMTFTGAVSNTSAYTSGCSGA